MIRPKKQSIISIDIDIGLFTLFICEPSAKGHHVQMILISNFQRWAKINSIDHNVVNGEWSLIVRGHTAGRAAYRFITYRIKIQIIARMKNMVSLSAMKIMNMESGCT